MNQNMSLKKRIEDFAQKHPSVYYPLVTIFVLCLAVVTFVLKMNEKTYLHEPPVIKGFYPGMSTEEFKNVAINHGGEIATDDDDYISVKGDCWVYGWINENGQLSNIKISGVTVNDLFQLDGMPFQMFAEKFCDTYNLYPMVPNDDHSGYIHYNEGFQITLLTDKSIIMELTQKPNFE